MSTLFVGFCFISQLLSFHNSGNIHFKVNKENPNDKRTIRRRDAVMYTVDNRRDILFYLTEDGSIMKEPLDSKNANLFTVFVYLYTGGGGEP